MPQTALMSMADQTRTDRFRLAPRPMWQGAAITATLFVLTGLASTRTAGTGDAVAAALALVFLAGLTALFVLLARRRPVQLHVGPDGLRLAPGFRRPLPWRDVHRVRRDGPHRHLAGRRDWLVVDPSPGVLPDYRLPGPRAAELWLMRRSGIRIPLHALDTVPEAVIQSIERYHPVHPAQ